MISQTRYPHLRVACMALLLLVAGLSGVSTGTGGDRPVFSGRATAVTAKVLGINLPPLADTGYFEAEEFLPPTQCTEQGIAVDRLSVEAEILCASTRGQGDHSFSSAHVAGLEANVAGVPVTATVLSSQASARCSAFAPVVAGTADLADARVGPIAIDPDPLVTPRNQPIPIPGVPGAYFIVGERTTTSNGNYSDITFTALRVVVPGPVPGTDTDVSFARVHADVRCQGQPVCPEPRFVTGGGFLSGKRHFVIAFREGDLDWGHLKYSDKAAGVRITADKPFTSADVYEWPNSDGAGTLTGRTTSGAPFRSEIIDAGEPGREDWFTLDVAGAAGYLEGGNLQVHKPCRDQ
jgi:hypothetical protein